MTGCFKLYLVRKHISTVFSKFYLFFSVTTFSILLTKVGFEYNIAMSYDGQRD